MTKVKPIYAKINKRTKLKGTAFAGSKQAYIDNNQGRIVRLYSLHDGTVKTKSGITLDSFDYTKVTEEVVWRVILKKVRDETKRARAKYPSADFMLAALTEETGEVAQAILDYQYGNDTIDHIEVEIIQAMTCLSRLLFEGSKEFKFKGIFTGSPHDRPVASIPPSSNQSGDDGYLDY